MPESNDNGLEGELLPARASPESASPYFKPPAGGESNHPSPVIPDHELIKRIGRGSYGEVWLARNVMGSYRAVKIVYRAAFDSERPYQREFDGLKKFEPISRSHHSQMDVLHVGRNEEGGYFYHVMELADDQRTVQRIDPEHYEPKTLKSELNARGRFSFQEGVNIGLGLDHMAWQKGKSGACFGL